MEKAKITYDELSSENEELKIQLEEALDTIDAIRNGRVDALIVNKGGEKQIYSLRTADQTYRVFVEKMNEGAVTINRDGIILYCNSRFARMIDEPLENVIGLPVTSFVPKSYLERFNMLVKYGWQEYCKEEIELENKFHKRVPCLLSCNTLSLDDGMALSLILTDLTILKDTERQLKMRNEQLAEAQTETEKLNNELEDTVKYRTNELFVSREHFKYLANNIPQITWTNLPDGQVNYYNQQWYNYTGLGVDQSLDDGWRRVIHPDDLEETMSRFYAALKSGGAFEIENRYKRDLDDNYRWHLNRALPLKNENDEIVFWVGTATDIEDQKKEMEKRDEFIGIASHELKTPLTSVKGYLQLIQSYNKTEMPPIVKQYISKANIALSKLQRLINDLLDVSKIQAGRLDYPFHVVNMGELVKFCVENAGHIYPSNVFISEVEGDFSVKGNAERLEQVLMNFISNAVKYSIENKKVLIKMEEINGRVRVSVTDSGIGLSLDQRERIFERFYRVEDKKHMTSGLGMGLFISSEIIKNHRGEINVESELKKGSTFYFELPLLKS